MKQQSTSDKLVVPAAGELGEPVLERAIRRATSFRRQVPVELHHYEIERKLGFPDTLVCWCGTKHNLHSGTALLNEFLSRHMDCEAKA